jgi:branched-chain amino acid transport system permease protein
MWIQFLISGVSAGCLYGLIGLGFALVYRTTGVFHVGYAVVFIAAGYCQHVLEHNLALPHFLSSSLGLLFAGGIGVGFEWGIFRPLWRRGSTWSGPFVASIGIYMVFSNLAAALFGNTITSLGNTSTAFLSSGQIPVTKVQLAELAAWVIGTATLYIMLKSTRGGLGIRALQDNPGLAVVLGMDLNHTRSAIFVAGSVLVAVAGLISAYDIGVTPYAGLFPVLAGAIGMMVGGEGIVAAAFGGLMLGVLQSLTVMIWSSSWQQVATFAALAAVLLLRRPVRLQSIPQHRD